MKNYTTGRTYKELSTHSHFNTIGYAICCTMASLYPTAKKCFVQKKSMYGHGLNLKELQKSVEGLVTLWGNICTCNLLNYTCNLST